MSQIVGWDSGTKLRLVPARFSHPTANTTEP